LYASGGQIGTHSHNQNRFATHDWRALPPNPTPAQVSQHWNDHVGLVDDVVSAALGVTDPQQVRAINCVRGSHVPSDDAWRLQLMSDFGFAIHQQGPDEQFYAYFKHYPMNPYRPSGDNMLVHDPNGPVVLTPFGPVLGNNDVHFGIAQDMRLPAVQARFLLTLLNWLHDVHVGATERIWVSGWGSHAADVMPDTPTRLATPVILDWLVEHFVSQPVGGHLAAEFSTMTASRQAYLDWETAHPGQASFSYSPAVTDWDVYPYLLPAIRYLTEASYESAMPAAGTVRWHRLTASAAAGGPYTLYVAYTTDGLPIVADLSSALGAGTIAAVNPATGQAQVVSTTVAPIATTGTLLVPGDKVLVLPGTGDFDGDGDVDAADLAQFDACFTGPGGGPIGVGCEPGDFDADGDIDCADWETFQNAWTEPGDPPNLSQCAPPIPAVSAWGSLISILSLLAGATVVLHHRRRASPTGWKSLTPTPIDAPVASTGR